MVNTDSGLLQRISCSNSMEAETLHGLRGEVIREWDQWPTRDRELLRQRYDRIATFIPLFDWVLFQPAGLRKHAVDRLKLRRGDRVLEVGCGTGRNFALLREVVGSDGCIYGIDLSAGMLRGAMRLCHRQRWRNVVLIEGDAANYIGPELMDGVLFSFSYNTMPHHLSILRQSWSQLRLGGRLVIMDAKPPGGLLGKLVLPSAIWLMKRTLLGNPLIRAWEHLAALVEDFEMDEFRFGSYYVCSGTRPVERIPRTTTAQSRVDFAVGGRRRGRARRSLCPIAAQRQ
jgi:demethylmenaquinone methyltransferase/2-methoxy-6-polyprenyl-1,4-benzoquinol methylase